MKTNRTIRFNQMLLLAYWDQDEIPPAADQTRLGDLEGNSGHPGYPTTVQGILNCWGGIADTAWIDNGEPPVAAFHGMRDKTVPYDLDLTNLGFKLNGSAWQLCCRSRECDRNSNEELPAYKIIIT